MEDLLNNTPLSSLVRRQSVVKLEHNMTIGEALKVLAANSILSAPMVLMPDIEDSSELETSPSLLGWVDIGDIMKALLNFLSANEDLPHAMLALMTALEKEGMCVDERVVRALLIYGLLVQGQHLQRNL